MLMQRKTRTAERRAPHAPLPLTGRWGCLLCGISDRIAPAIGPPQPPQGRLTTASLPDSG